MMRIVRSGRLAGVLMVVLLLATGCSPSADDQTGDDTSQEETEDPADSADASDDETSDAAASGGVDVLRLAGGDFGYPTPFAWVRGPGRIQAGMVFDTLVWRDGTGDFIPWLASDWEVSDDGTQWTFTLRDGVTWQDGEPLTARDVEFSFDYYTEGPGAETRASGGLGIVDDVVADGDTTVVFTTSEPNASFHENVSSSMFVVPEHVWADIEDPAAERGDAATIGSGAYRLESADPANGTYRYVANEDFFLQPPVVREVQFVPAADELLALQRGELSVAEVAREPIPEEQLAALQEQFMEVEGTRDWNLALHFNLDQGFPYDEQQFRAGVAHAIDREDMVSRRLFGAGVVGSAGGLSPDHPMFNEDLPGYEYDTTRANELLDEVGLVDVDGDGVRDLPDGSAFQPTILASARFPAQGPQLVSEYLRGVGIDAQVEVLDRAAADEAAAQGNYTLALVGYGGVLNDPDTLRSRFASTSEEESFSRAQGYADDRVDELAAQQLRTTDVEQRTEIVKELQAEIAADLPVLPLYVPQRRLFADAELFDGWTYTPGCSACRGSRNKLLYVTGRGTL